MINNEYEEKDELKEILEDSSTFHKLSPPTVSKTHDWRQEGPQLVCKSCESPHGFHIGINKRFSGYDKKGGLIINNI